MTGHGGKRLGAGAPRKWRFQDILRIGQACEERFREASELAVKERLGKLPHAENIRLLQENAKKLPLHQRRDWLEGDGYEDHSEDIEAWLHARDKTPFDEETGAYARPANRITTVSSRPPRGTRKQIVAEVAKEGGLKPKQVENLWDAYRRFEREARSEDQS